MIGRITKASKRDGSTMLPSTHCFVNKLVESCLACPAKVCNFMMPSYSRLGVLPKLGFLLSICAVSISGLSAELTSNKGVTFDANVRVAQDESGQEAQNTVQQTNTRNISVNPFFSLNARGRKANFGLLSEVDISNQSTSTSDMPDETIVRPRALATGNVKLNRVSVSGFLSVSQSPVNRSLPTAPTTAFDQEYTRNYNYRLEPKFKDSVFNLFNVELVGSHSRSFFPDDEQLETATNSGTIKLGQNPRNGRYLWEIAAASRRTDSEASERYNEFRELKLTSGIAPSGHWLLSGAVGMERFSTHESLQESENSFWSIEYIWRPARNTLVGVGYSERAFGSSPFLRLNHRVGRSQITFLLQRQQAELASIVGFAANSSQFSEISFEDVQTGSPSLGQLGQSVFNEINGSDIASAPSIGTQLVISDDVVIDDRVSLSYKVSGRKSTFFSNLYYIQRNAFDLLVDGEISELDTKVGEIFGASTAFSRSFGRRINASFRLDWLQEELADDSDITSKKYGAVLSIGYRL